MMGIEFTFGVIGSILLILAWLPSSIRVLKKHESNMPLGFAAIFTVGVGLLVIYSILINEMIFVVLNLATFFFGVFNMYYIPHKTEKLHEIEEIFGRKGKKYYVVKKKGGGRR